MFISKTTFTFGLTLAFVTLLAVSSCTPRYTVDISDVNPDFLRPLELHAAKAAVNTSAQLVQVTVRSSRITKRFNMEMYHRSDTSWFYYGGFLGKGGFKGVLADSSVILLMPGDKTYYAGAVGDMSDPDLSEYKPILRRFRDALAGVLICGQDTSVTKDYVECEKWHQSYSIGKSQVKRVEYVYRDLPDLSIEVDLGHNRDDFPFFRFKKAQIVNSESGSRIKFKFIEEHFGEFPPVKFEIPDTTGWTRIDYFDLN